MAENNIVNLNRERFWLLLKKILRVLRIPLIILAALALLLLGVRLMGEVASSHLTDAAHDVRLLFSKGKGYPYTLEAYQTRHVTMIGRDPLILTRESCTVLYDLLDAGYDAEPIRDFSRSLGSVPIIPVNPRRRGEGNGPEMEPDRAERFRKRSGVERFNSHLNDEHGGRTVRVRGHAKVALHLAFGVLVIAVEQVFRLLE